MSYSQEKTAQRIIRELMWQQHGCYYAVFCQFLYYTKIPPRIAAELTWRDIVCDYITGNIYIYVEGEYHTCDHRTIDFLARLRPSSCTLVFPNKNGKRINLADLAHAVRKCFLVSNGGRTT